MKVTTYSRRLRRAWFILPVVVAGGLVMGPLFALPFLIGAATLSPIAHALVTLVYILLLLVSIAVAIGLLEALGVGFVWNVGLTNDRAFEVEARLSAAFRSSGFGRWVVLVDGKERVRRSASWGSTERVEFPLDEEGRHRALVTVRGTSAWPLERLHFTLEVGGTRLVDA